MATIRENIIIIKSDAVESIEYVKGSLKATKGQPKEDNVVIDHTEGVVSILVRSGRKKSKPVAESFISASGGRGHMVATQGGDAGYPDELNFTFTVSIKWKNGETSRVQLGQGSRALVRNNWWIGSEDIKAGKFSFSGGETLKIESGSVDEDLDSTFDAITGRIPPQFSGLVKMIGRGPFKDLFGVVNIFKIG